MVTEKDTRISHSAWQHGTQWINGRNWSCWPQQIQKKGALVQNLLRNLHSSGKPQRCIWALAKKNHQKHSSVWQTQAEHGLSFSWSTERIPFYRRLLPFCLFRHQQWMSNVLSSPSKWKKWLCWFRRGLPSAAATGTRFSSRFSLWWSSLTWWLSVILRDILQVGQDVSCSSQDRRQELTGKQQHCGELAVFFQEISISSTSSSCSICCTQHQHMDCSEIPWMSSWWLWHRFPISFSWKYSSVHFL